MARLVPAFQLANIFPIAYVLQVIKGYSKSSGYLPGEEFVDTTYRNSWNAVFVAGGWRLVQSNWGMMSVNNKVSERDIIL